MQVVTKAPRRSPFILASSSLSSSRWVPSKRASTAAAAAASARFSSGNSLRLFQSTDATSEQAAAAAAAPSFSSSSISSSLDASSSSSSSSSSTTVTTTSNSNVVPFSKPPRVIRDDLPIVYVYDHCPFCVRVRLVLGLKNVKHTVHFLANDDVQTPTALVGKKIAPIFQWNEANIVMPESTDICHLIDRDERLAAEPQYTNLILPATDRTDLHDWQASVRDLLRGLQRPRYVATGLLPEFQQLDARHAFVSNHVMPPYTSDEWKDMTLASKLNVYAEAMAKDPADDIEELNRKLVELDDIVYSDHHCSPCGGVSYDDVDLFSRLRSVTIIKGVEWPAKLERYMQRMAELGDVPLYDEMAL